MGLRHLGKSARVTPAPICSRTTTATAGSDSSSEAMLRRQHSARALEAIGGQPTMAEAVTDRTARQSGLMGQRPSAS